MPNSSASKPSTTHTDSASSTAVKPASTPQSVAVTTAIGPRPGTPRAVHSSHNLHAFFAGINPTAFDKHGHFHPETSATPGSKQAS